jgi:putative inorganic carbon (hco3(-)) transporter
MSFVPAIRELKYPVVALSLGLAGATILLSLATSDDTKLIVAVLAAALCLAGMTISGNPRLYCLWGFMLTLPFDLSKRIGRIIPMMGGENSFRLEISDLFLVALTLFLARDMWTQRRAGLRVPKVTFIWIVIMLMGCLTVALGPYRRPAAHEVVRMAKDLLLFLVIANELERPNRVLHCAAGLTLGVVVQAITGLIQYFTRKHFGLDFLGETGAGTLDQLAAVSVNTEKVFRVGAFLTHPNIFGIFLAALLPMAIGGFLLRVGKGYRLLFLSGATLGMAALIGTQSRSGWISFAAAFALLLLLTVLHQGLRRRSLMAATVALAALLAVGGIFAGKIMNRILDSKESAMISRYEYIRDAWGLIKAKPLLGWGLNSYVLAVPPFTQYGARGARDKYLNWIPPVHNIYLLWWAETGLIGLAIHLALLGGIIWVAVGNLRVRNELLFLINAACLSGMLAFIVDGIFSFSLRFNSILRVFWVLAGIIMAVHYWRLRHSVPGQS